MGEYDHCYRLFLNKVQIQIILSNQCSYQLKVLGNKTSRTVTCTIRRSFGITVKRLMTLSIQYCLPHTPGDTGDGQDASTPCSLP